MFSLLLAPVFWILQIIGSFILQGTIFGIPL